MIKILNNSLNLNIQGLNNFCSQDKENISDLFLFIFLNLIEENFSENIENKNFSRGFSLLEFFNNNKNIKGSQDLIEKSDENEELDLIKLFWLQIFSNNELKSLDGKDSIDSKSSKLNLSNETSTLKSLNLTLNEQNKVKSFELDEEKLSFIKEIISLTINNKINFSQLNQIIEKVFSDSAINNITELKEKFSRVLNFLKSENVSNNSQIFQDKKEFLVNQDIKWISTDELLSQMENSNINEIKSSTFINPQNSDEIIQLNKEAIQSYLDVFQNNNQNNDKQKNEENQNLLFKDWVNNSKNFNDNSFVFSLNKKYPNQDEPMEQFGRGDDLMVKKVEILKENLKFYDSLDKKFKIEANDFQKIFDITSIKSDFKIENTVKSEDIKTMDFHKFPDDFLKIIKEMSLEMQPDGEKRAFIKLEPPEMGFLELEIKVKNKNVEIIVRIEKPELLQEIKQNLHYIKTTFEESGLNLKEFQMFLGSSFEGRTLARDFGRENRDYSRVIEKTERMDQESLISEILMPFYNRNGKYYYVV